MTIAHVKHRLAPTGILLALFVCLSVSSVKADTTDFCHVYLNDSLVLKIGQHEFPTATLHLSKINPGDSIWIGYWTDTGWRYAIYVVRDNRDKAVKRTSVKPGNAAIVPENYTPIAVNDLPREGCHVYCILGSSRPETHLFDIVFD